MSATVQDVFMLFGDSITQSSWQPQGLAQRLASVYVRKLDVINRGLSGYNTEWAIPVFERTFATRTEQHHVPKVRILTIWFGANDACIKPSPQHVPLPQFVANLKRLVNLVLSPTSSRYSPSTHVILITPPPVNTYQRGAALASRNPPVELDRKFEVTREYAEAVKQVGFDENVEVIDIWTGIWEAAGKDERALSKYLEDGLHLNAAGYDIVYQALMEKIEEKYREDHYDSLMPVFASWEQLI